MLRGFEMAKKNDVTVVPPPPLQIDCEDLIRHMLVLDPVKRFSTKHVFSHRWTKDCEPDPKFEQMLTEYERIAGSPEQLMESTLNEQIIHNMVSLGIERESIIQVNLISL